MKLVYSRQALADLDQIATYYASHASPRIAETIGRRLGDVIDRIRRTPEAGPRVSQRSQVRVVAVVRYPFRIFTGCATTQSTFCISDTRRGAL
jgi:plasmid stabilization system protein ParE